MSAAEGYVMSDRQIETNRICDLQWPIRWPDRSQTRAAVIYYTLGTDLPPPNLLVHGNVLVYTFNQTAVGVIVFVLMCDKRHLRATVYADEPLIHPPPHVDDVKDYYADVLAANYGRLRLLCPVPQCRRFLRRHFEGEIDERLIASIEFAFDDDEAELGIKVYPELQPGADLACGSFVDTKDQVSRMHEYARARTDTLVGTVLYMNPSKDFNGCGAVMRSIYELWSTHAVDINVYAEVTRCAGAQCVYACSSRASCTSAREVLRGVQFEVDRSRALSIQRGPFAVGAIAFQFVARPTHVALDVAQHHLAQRALTGQSRCSGALQDAPAGVCCRVDSPTRQLHHLRAARVNSFIWPLVVRVIVNPKFPA
jgi:hypothetical protein